MPRLHLITGHRQINRSDAPRVIYCGHDGDIAGKLRDAAIESGAVLIADAFHPASPVTRYASKLAPLEPSEAGGVSEVVSTPVEIGEAKLAEAAKPKKK